MCLRAFFRAQTLHPLNSQAKFPTFIMCEKTISKPMYTLKDVAAHSSPKNCWIIIKGTVYDVTEFLPQHPGGAESTPLSTLLLYIPLLTTRSNSFLCWSRCYWCLRKFSPALFPRNPATWIQASRFPISLGTTNLMESRTRGQATIEAPSQYHHQYI